MTSGSVSGSGGFGAVGCPRGEDAGAYLMGSLDPAERAGFATHLPRCPHCLREVGALAGLPGLLARSPGPPRGSRPLPTMPEPSLARAGGEPGPVEAALAEIRRRRARQRGLVAAALVLVALVGVGGTVAGAAWGGSGTEVRAAAALPVAMSPAGGVPATAALELTARAWGTEVVMRCRYQGTGGYVGAAPPVYVLVATAADGSTTRLARWSAIPDQDVVLATATDLPRDRLASMEIEDARGAVVLRTDHI